MAKAKIQKPLASYYATRHKMTVGGVPCGFARPPVGPQDRAARMANKLSSPGGPMIDGSKRERAHDRAKALLKAWQELPVEERLALQDAELARATSLAPSPEMPAAEISPAECAPAVEAQNPPPESVSALDGAESAPVAAIEADAPVANGPDDESEPVSDPMPAPEPVEAAPVSLADMIRAMADKIEALESQLSDVQRQRERRAWALRAARDWRRIAMQNADHVDKARADVAFVQRRLDDASEHYRNRLDDLAAMRAKRRRALLALRGKRLLLRRAVAQCAEHVATRIPNADYARVLRERDEAREQLQIAKSQIMCLESRLPAPVAPVTPPPVDLVAAKRKLLRDMGLDSGWRITGAVQPMNVQVRALERA